MIKGNFLFVRIKDDSRYSMTYYLYSNIESKSNYNKKQNRKIPLRKERNILVDQDKHVTQTSNCLE